MKRVFAAILAVLYLSTSMGATVHFHYCMGRLVSWGLVGHTGRTTCDFCGMAMLGTSGECMVGMKNCCHEEQKQIKNNSDQKPGQEPLRFLAAVSLAADLHQTSRVMPVPFSQVISFPAAHGPPLSGESPLFLRYCNFRI